ncbi:ABC transporter ATP-binding protein [Chryseosolibacter indicus]|uniref:ATP-binding cassette domain-containing protein n=1 Tax=Chryseosolibacter indicus TaxID=2782351 RepID=A0ABS5VRD3_9BACT|nr:ATP-binding cassette domain-containing protein [Chryseosolibacter indicus]MBT1704004.1 ATP-binding cassette domain-containing protein [Chryseosolibacter indicus]
MIRSASLSYQYPNGKQLRFPDVNLSAAEQCLLLGESGSGKTTFLHLLSGLLKSQQGAIHINGHEITKLKGSALDHFRGQHIGFIFQRNHLISALSVKNNLLMSPYLAGLPQRSERVDEVLRQLGIGDKKNSRIQELSQGQAQRVAIARAILNKPSIIFADEPTSALDDKNCELVIELLADISSQNKSALIIATHDQRLKSHIPKQITL